MLKSKGLIYILVLSGAALLLYAQDDIRGNKYVLIIGIVILMFGLFKLWSSLSSRPNFEDDYLRSDEEE